MSSVASLPAPGTAASSSIWARRMITKSVPATDAEVELNVLSLLLDVPLASLDEQDLARSPVSLHSPYSPWSPAVGTPALHRANSFGAAAPNAADYLGSASPVPMPCIHRSKSIDSAHLDDDGYSLEMHAAQTAVKAALDVLEEPSLNRGLRISTSLSHTPAAGNSLGLRGCLTAPLSPSLSSPVSPAESCFSGTESDGTKKKGRARMSQEKRKRLARRREREALVAAITQQPHQLHDAAGNAADLHNYLGQSYLGSAGSAATQLSRSAPATPMRSYFAPASSPSSSSSHNSALGGGFPFASSPSEMASAAAAFNTPLSSPRSAATVGFVAAEMPSPALTHASATTTASAFGSIGTPGSSPTALAALGNEMSSSSPPTLVVQPPSPQRLRASHFAAASRVSAKQASSNASGYQWTGFVSPSNLASVY